MGWNVVQDNNDPEFETHDGLKLIVMKLIYSNFLCLFADLGYKCTNLAILAASYRSELKLQNYLNFFVAKE